jgi:predicted short-subunit dehydrogenase-like oxidoreductase (DUF2520 family)
MSASAENRNIVMIGAGNVAWHIGHQFVKAGFHVAQVYNRSREAGLLLAGALQTSYTDRLGSVTPLADLYVIAVSDDAITSVIDQAHFADKLIVHTAGSVNINVFEGRAENYGVIYPLQTFTVQKALDFSKVPVFIEANNPKNLSKLKLFAEALTGYVYMLNSEQRAYLHLAGVIASNFSNHMIGIAENILHEKEMDYMLLKPLLEETVAKAFLMPPFQAQTGPAVRRNNTVIEMHRTMLNQMPEVRALYEVVTESISATGGSGSKKD